MKIGFIGSGKVGQSFGSYLYEKGFHVVGYFSRSIDSARSGAALVGGRGFSRMEELVEVADIIFITTPDDMIQQIASTIADLQTSIENKHFVHMSGAHRASIMQEITKRHPLNRLYSLHPLQAFARVEKAVKALSHTMFTLEADQPEVIEEILKECGNQYFLIRGDQKTMYHAAACVASNYLVTLIDMALNMMKTAGFEEKEAYQVLLPLMNGTLRNIESVGTSQALTGPVARGDSQTVKKHLIALKEQMPRGMALYQSLGKAATELASKEKLKGTDQIEALNQLWKEGVK
ncbi:Rossmann-like and DUF2520 domain-containing protein [Alkaliphilus crotonatoxidans]